MSTAARLLREAGADVVTAGPGVPRLLLARRVRDQAGLGREARAANLDGAFAVRRPVRPGRRADNRESAGSPVRITASNPSSITSTIRSVKSRSSST